MTSRGIGAWQRMCSTALVGASLWLTAGAALAQEQVAFEGLLPARTLVCLRLRNPSDQPGFTQSALHKIGQEPEMKAFVEHVKEVYRELQVTYQPMAPFDLTIVEQLLQGEVSLAFTGLNLGEQGPQPGFVASVKSPMSAERLEAALLSILRLALQGAEVAPQPAPEHKGYAVKSVPLPFGPLCYTFIRDRLVAALGQDALRAALDQLDAPEGSLAGSACFQHVAAKTGWASSTCGLYVNTAGLLTQFGAMIPPPVLTEIQTQGLDKIQAIGFTSRFADRGIRDTAYVYAPGHGRDILPPTGMPVDLSLLKCVPKDADMMSLGRGDLSALYTLVFSLWQKFDAEGHGEAMAQIAEAEQRLGFRIKEDLLDSLGTQMLWFHGPYETIFMVEVKDGNKLESCLVKLGEFGQGKVEWNEMGHGGVTIRHLDITAWPVPITVSYTYHKQFMVVGLFPQTLKSFLNRVARQAPSITESKDFQRVAGMYLGGCSAVSYSDIGPSLVGFYDLVVFAAQALHGVKQVPLRPELMPPATLIEPYVFGSGGGCIPSADGLLFQQFSPLGACGNLFAAFGMYVDTRRIGTLNSVATTGILAGMLLPALSRARGEARKAVCKSNLKQIGLGIAMYANDHDENYPQKLEELYDQYVTAKQIFHCPSTGKPKAGPGIQFSYRYVGRLSKLTDPQVIIAYDKRGNHHRDGRNVLFYDGHVRWIPRRAFRRDLRKSLKLVKQAGWDQLPPERRAAIEAFYADAAPPQ